ncbi:MAG: molybdenum cofactor guanylyltransferase [Acidobacteriaceae bacterium]
MALATGFVLAGGHSTRLGQDKVLLMWDGGTLLEVALRKLRAVCGDGTNKEDGGGVYICTSRKDLGQYAPVLPDAADAAGPLGGIVAALEKTCTDWGLFLPVDLPMVPVVFLSGLLERAHQGTALAVVPFFAGRPQPLCAAYHRDLLPGLRRALREGKYKVMQAIEQAALRPDGTSAIDRLDIHAPDQAPWFLNINTPEDLEQARAQVRATSGIL